jgi:hypothetical protein
MIGEQYDDGANHCHQEAIQVQPRCGGCPENVENESPDNRAHNPENDVEEDSLPLLIHDLAGYKARD